MFAASVRIARSLALVVAVALPLTSHAAAPSWAQIDALISAQKYEEASRGVEARLKQAQQRGDEQEWAKALSRATTLRISLHGYETALKTLREQPWPKGALPKSAVNLTYAHALLQYAQAYGWELRGRERVETRGELELKSWSHGQVVAEAHRALSEVWADREALGRARLSAWADFLRPGTYPTHVRGTLRDAATYLMVETFADSGTWSPGQENELFRLDFAALLRGDGAAVPLTDAAAHPLLKLGTVLADLEAWHTAAGRKEAALEARLERIRRLSAHFGSKKQREALLVDLASRLPQARGVPWFSMGKALEAELRRDLGERVAAHRAAREGHEAYPASPGGQRCLAVKRELEAPDYQLEAMASDAPGKRSVQLTHRNLPRVFFRAYRLELDALIAEWKDYSLFPQGEKLQALIRSGTPAARWTTELPATHDFESHVTFVTPPLEGQGLYLVVASAREDFAAAENRIVAAPLHLTDLVLLSRQVGPDEHHFRVVDARSGAPVPGATVALYRHDWRVGHRQADAKQTDRDGAVSWKGAPGGENGSFSVVVRHGERRALQAQQLGFYRGQRERPQASAFIYTDRTVYRPNQTVRWKVVAYEGGAEANAYRTSPKRSLTVGLYDGNNQRVTSVKVQTNSFGTAAGEFVIPSGKVLGQWSLRTEPSGFATIRVEEYKRPTFEVELLPAASALRLNKPAMFKGTAKYYFGQPVTAGTVRWQITRQPRYPGWWSWYRLPVGAAQVVASGSTPVGEDGAFAISFTPVAEEGVENREVSYVYAVNAALTDEGGETRSADRSYRIGYAAVEARLDPEGGFVAVGQPARFTLRRTDLDGEPREGAGTWRIVTLRQPAQTLLPAEEPWPAPPPGTPAPKVQTPGDKLRPRWTTDYQPAQTLRGWAEGDTVARGSAQGAEQQLEQGGLKAGAYRILYETDDGFGARVVAQQDFVVGGPAASIAVPLGMWVEKTSVTAGGKVRLFLASGLAEQPVMLELQRQGGRTERKPLVLSRNAAVIELPVTVADRGGIQITASAVRDHQLMRFTETILVPHDHKELKVAFSTFRDRLRPGAKETFRVTVTGSKGERLEKGAAEVLAYMYDRSLDYFAPHEPANPLSLYGQTIWQSWLGATLGQAQTLWVSSSGFGEVPSPVLLEPARLLTFSGYPMGGPGRRRAAMRGEADARAEVMAREQAKESRREAPAAAPQEAKMIAVSTTASGAQNAAAATVPVRSNFAETAFFVPQLVSNSDGSVSFEFQVPDSVTSWKVWAHALTRDLRAGSAQRETRSVKELMVRPYLPRFFREGDEAELQVVINNTGAKEAAGELSLTITDTELNTPATRAFLVGEEPAVKRFTVAAGKSTTVSFRLKAPRQVRTYAFEVTAKAGAYSDGERRPVPLLPSRLHLAQSRFVTLQDRETEVMRFEDLAKNADPTLSTEKLVVTVDAQLFYSALQALPYLVDYPYECTEQTLNRFVSTGIVSSLYGRYPAVAEMAKQLSTRKTQFEAWDGPDENRRVMLEETPYLELAKGGPAAEERLQNLLDPKIAASVRQTSLAELQKMQTASGGFPWFPGGPPSPYMTLYLLHGFARASEYGVEVPKEVVQRAWGYVAEHYRSEYAKRLGDPKTGGYEFLTFLNYVATAFPDASYTGDALTLQERRQLLDYSFAHWKSHSPYLKGYLALTLKRMNRLQDAKTVWASVMDSAKSTPEEGTFWAPEDRGWLWYNDRIETHAFALRVLMELDPKDARRHGLVQWLLLNKKVNHWRSTRATAEAVYALVKYLEAEGSLGIREEIRVVVGPKTETLVFRPEVYTGKKNQIVVDGEDVVPGKHAEVTVSKETKGFAFASATWHFATDRLPAEARGDFLQVSRRYFRRERRGTETVLQPLAEGTAISVGDELEVQLSVRSKHAAEFIHLKDPRAAGLEPERAVSGYRWDQGLGFYEETRDTGANYFFDWLPAGEYTLRYRLRANMAGTFRVGPASLQSMYAPEFNAYSAGHQLKVEPAK